MATWRKRFTVVPEVDMCYSCFETTKYSCLKCTNPICNRCSVFEPNEETPGWIAGKAVGYCLSCKQEESKVKTNSKRAVNTSREAAKPVKAMECTTDQESLQMSGESDREENENGDEEYEEDSSAEQAEERIRKGGKKTKKAGRKAKWTQTILNDAVDIIIGSDYYKTKLIFTNVKTQKNGQIYAAILDQLKVRCKARNENIQFTVPQLRSKFKKLISECKRVALTIKTASGIKRFQEERGYSTWFNQLFEVVKTRDSCSPELAVEPSASKEKNNQTTENEGIGDEQKNSSVEEFVPVKSAPTKKQKKEDPLVEAIHLMRTAIENDPTKELVKFLKSDIEKSREHELKLYQMLLTHSNPSPQPQHGYHHGDYVVPSVVNQGPSIPTYHFAPQCDYALWDGNHNSFRPIPAVAPSPSFSSDSSRVRSSPQSSREGNESPFYHSL